MSGGGPAAEQTQSPIFADLQVEDAVTAEPLEALYPPVVMSPDRQLMADDQAVLAFLQHLDLMLSEALRGDEQQRLRRLTMTHALVMALLADPQELDQALRQAAARLAELDS
jgi:hypothetical protein